MDLSIIIINWNSVDYLRKCLKSIFSTTKDIQYEVIVLDNASYDGCERMLSREFSQVKFIQNTENGGFAKANNIAARHSIGDVLLFLNPDTEIIQGSIDALYYAFCSMKRAGSAGPRLLNSDKTLQIDCLQAFPKISTILLNIQLIRELLPKSKFWGTSALFSKSQAPVKVEGISGACLMTFKSIFQQVGGFNEGYFMYYEDMDYCYKVNKNGYNNYFVPNSTVVHHGGKSGDGGYGKFSNITMAESGWKYFIKWKGLKYAILFRAALGIKSACFILIMAGRYLMTHSDKKTKRMIPAINKWKYILLWCLSKDT